MVTTSYFVSTNIFPSQYMLANNHRFVFQTNFGYLYYAFLRMETFKANVVRKVFLCCLFWLKRHSLQSNSVLIVLLYEADHASESKNAKCSSTRTINDNVTNRSDNQEGISDSCVVEMKGDVSLA